MKIHLKSGEHARLVHDANGTFSFHIYGNELHITANRDGDPMTLTVRDATEPLPGESSLPLRAA